MPWEKESSLSDGEPFDDGSFFDDGTGFSTGQNAWTFEDPLPGVDYLGHPQDEVEADVA